MFLEIATTLGALLGAYLTAKVPANAIAIIFGLVLTYSAYVSRRVRPRTAVEQPPDPLATKLKMNGTFPDTSGLRSYNVYHVPTGFGVMFGAGALVRIAGNRLRRAQSRRHGPGDENPVQSLDDDQQFHDRRNRSRQRRSLSQPRIH